MSKVMIVDDRLDSLDLARMALELEGIEVVATNEGRRITEMVIEQRPDLVLMDFSMPGLNGPELVAWLKNTPPTRNIPVVMYTAMPRSVVQQIVACDGVISKDGDLDQFVSAVQTYLGRVA